MNSDNLLEMFEDLTPEQVKEFRARILPALEHIRAEIINPSNGGNNQKGETKMNGNEEFTPEETAQIRADVQAATQRVIENRETTRIEPLIAAYKAEMRAARGQRHLAPQIRAKYRALGVPVDSISFTV